MSDEKTNPYRYEVTVPLVVAFTIDPEELILRDIVTDRKPTLAELVEYLQRAIRLDIDNEGEGQPETSAFAACGVDWDRATMKTPLQLAYPILGCPDCGYEIPDNANEGDQCENCGHVMWLPKEDDDAEV